MKLALILMIKNEEKILRRCLEAVENVVDCFCILDTGSTDNTVEIAKDFLKTHTGCVTIEPWQNFGHNRTVSFQNAQKYIRDELKWTMNETFGLLLDADMMFVPGKLREQNLSKIGYRLIQVNGGLEYYNTRVVRMDFPWKCVGVTHEYWDGPTETISKDICFIDDKNDGGCKHDKYERDQRLLEKGLEDEPQNVRYMFYLAQTYKCLGKYKESIAMYKKRIAAGGWAEEVWYSHYMIGECWKALGNAIKFEEWMQRAHSYRLSRVESIYKLAEHYRVVGQHYKAYHYTKLGLATPYPKDDVLFIEGDVYRGKFDYESSILEYYVSQDKKRGVRASMNTFLKYPAVFNNVLSNLHFYMTELPSTKTKPSLPSPFGDDFRPSAISIDNYPYANVRYVNYWMSNGEYFTKDNCPVQTENAYINLETNEVLTKMIDSSVTLPRFNTHVKGLEDVRLFHSRDSLKFTATSVREYAENVVRVVTGEYNKETGNYENVTVLGSPVNAACEKNWLPIENTDMFIYGWHPYTLVNSNSETVKKSNTPAFFSHLRGSAPPVKQGDKYWVLTHFVEYSKPRKYYHCIIELNKSLEPSRITLPFVFKSASVEYCVSFRFQNENTLEFYTSFMDSNPHKIVTPISNFDWVSI
jgi:glycosyltransferase involved in cell wall biosynthesis